MIKYIILLNNNHVKKIKMDFQNPNCFTPDGNLEQVEYALNCVKNVKNMTVCIQGTNSICIATEKESNKLMVQSPSVHKLNDNISCCIVGHSPDGNRLINLARTKAGEYNMSYGSNISIPTLANYIANYNQSLTQNNFVRPVGVTLIIFGINQNNEKCICTVNPAGEVNSHAAVVFGPNENSATEYLENVQQKTLLNTLSDDEIKKCTLACITNKLNANNIEMICITKSSMHTISEEEINSILSTI
jgi:20S proteasome alpha/beta subunit